MATRAEILIRLRRFLLSLPFLIAAGLLAVYALVGFLLVPYLIQREAPGFARERLGAEATIVETRVNPFLLTLELKGFRLAEGQNRPLIAFDRLFVDLEAGSLFRWAWTFNTIVVERPEVALDIDPKGELNLARVINRLKKNGGESAKAEQDGGPPRMIIHRAAIERGAVSISDRSDATPAGAAIDPIDFELRDISTLPDHGGDYTLTGRLPAGATLSWRGKLSLQPIASSGEIGIHDLKVATLWNFLRDELAVEEPGGALTLGLRYEVGYTGGQLQAAATGIGLRGKDLSVTPRDAKAPILAVAQIDLRDGTLDAVQRTVHFPALLLRGGNLSFVSDASGISNWQKILVKDEDTAKAAKNPDNANLASWRVALDQVRAEDLGVRFADESRVRPLLVEADKAAVELALSLETGRSLKLALENIGVELANARIGSTDDAEPVVAFETAKLTGGKIDLAARAATIEAIELHGGATRIVRETGGELPIAELFAAKESTVEEGPPFDFALRQIALSGHAVGVSDLGTEPAIAYELKDTEVKLENIAASGEENLKFEVAAKIGEGGTLRASGTYDRSQSRAEGQLDVSRLALIPVEPLLNRHVVLKLASGSASAKGRFVWSGEGKSPGLRYRGSAAIDDLLFNEPNGERFLSWKSLAASGVRIDSGRSRYTIEDVHLIEPGAKLVIQKDRSVNVSDVIREPEKSPAAPEPAASKPASPEAEAKGGETGATVSVSRVRVEKGRLDFADLSLVLPFSTQIQALGGAITGLSSDTGSRATVKLEGQVEDYGLARIDGTINPFKPKAHTDISVVFRNVEMTPLSPYAATFAGRKIASGRLSLDLQYKLNDSQLSGDNKILLEQFTLGERVESPSALDLPLDLAVAILTDSEGRIDIAVPVRGNVDSPEFSYGHLIGQAIRMLITRIVSAPFRALGAMFGGGGEAEKLQEVVFDAGSSRLLPPEREKLSKIVEAMKKRPQLKLVVQGRYHPERDGTALRETALRRTLAERLEMKLAPGEDPGPPALDRARTQRALEALLAARSGADAAEEFAAAFGKEKGREVTRVNPVLGLVGRASPDRELYEAMYRRLIELQPLPEAALQELARGRSAAILKQLTDGSGLGPERLGQQEPEATTEAISAKLSLDVAAKRNAPQGRPST